MDNSCIVLFLELWKKNMNRQEFLPVASFVFHLNGSFLGHVMQLVGYFIVLPNWLFDEELISIAAGIGKLFAHRVVYGYVENIRQIFRPVSKTWNYIIRPVVRAYRHGLWPFYIILFTAITRFPLLFRIRQKSGSSFCRRFCWAFARSLPTVPGLSGDLPLIRLQT